MIPSYILFGVTVLFVLWRFTVWAYNLYIEGDAILMQQQFDVEAEAINKLDTVEAVTLAYKIDYGPDWDGYDYEAALDRLVGYESDPVLRRRVQTYQSGRGSVRRDP